MIKMIYDSLYLIPLTLVSVLWFAVYGDITMPLLAAGIIALFISIAGVIVIHLKTDGKIIAGGTILAILAAGYFLMPDTVYDKYVIDITGMLMIASVAAISFIAGKLICLTEPGRIILAISGLASLLVSMFRGYDPLKIICAFSFGFAFVVLADEIQLHWKKTGGTEHKCHLVFISPFIIILTGVIFIMPVSDKPYDWAFVMRIAEFAKENIDKLERYLSRGKQTDYGDAFIGFAEDTGFDGDIKSSDKTVMDISFGANAPLRLYLRGKTFDTYTGTEWIKSYTETGYDSVMDILELQYSVALAEDAVYYDYYRSGFITVNIKDMESSHVFAPCKTTGVTPAYTDINVYESGGDLLFDRMLVYDDSYDVNYYYINSDSPVFEELMAKRCEDDRYIWDEILINNRLSDSPMYSYDAYLKYREKMREIYLPETEISPEMNAYLDELLEGADSDIEKLRRIEALLSSMTYSKTPGEMPGDVDTPSEYLDYLIFETQTGYCTHYATAFVLLARAEGIPARFVQGFRVKSDKYNTVSVPADRAHAWPECYMEGFGWIPFEPTPGYRITQRWKTTLETDDAEAETDYQGESVSEPDIYIPEMNREDGKENSPFPWKAVLIFVVSAIGTACTLAGLIILIKKIKYMNMSDKDKFVTMYRKNMHIIKILGFEISPGETLEEYSERIAGRVPADALGFIGIYEAYIYNDAMPGEEEVGIINGAYKILINTVKESGFGKRIRLLEILTV